MSEVKAKNNILEDAVFLRLLSRYGFRRNGDVFIRGKAEQTTVVVIDFDGAVQRERAGFLKAVMSVLNKKTTAVICAGSDCSAELRCRYLIAVRKGESGVAGCPREGNMTIDFSADEEIREKYLKSVFQSVHAIYPDIALTGLGIETRFFTLARAEQVALQASAASVEADKRLGVFAMPVVKRFAEPYFPSEKAVYFFTKNGMKTLTDFTSPEIGVAVFANEKCWICMDTEDIKSRAAVKQTLEDINGKKTRFF